MNNETREELRTRMRAMRAQLSTEIQRNAARDIARQAISLAAYREAHTVMAYIAARGELSLDGVIEDVLASGKRLALPRCEASGVMTARLVKSLDQLEPGAFGLMEPTASCPVLSPEEIDLILVPGTAFDRLGNRIGQGGGYYDRFLTKTRAVLAGVCHDEALLERIDAQTHDVRMDMVLTPGAILRPNEKENSGG